MKPSRADRGEALGTGGDGSPRTTPHRVRLPGFHADNEVGLGDLVKRATSLAGIRPCGPCSQRAATLNRWMVFSGRR
jgi:hypothetical protein